jgi:tRNA (pseudouridine54-N1)-methyltransferase
MRTFVVIGQTASASEDFSLDDLPGSSGRLDVLLRCLRAALLFSHGLRPDARVYLVLRGGPQAPRVLKVDGATCKFLRPDERSLATLVKKTLAAAAQARGGGFVELRPGLALAAGDLECVHVELGEAALYVLEPGAADIRTQDLAPGNQVFFVGDHAGFDEATRAELAALSARPLGVGPLSLHSDDVVALVSNELDRRADTAGSARS